jgi:hypothetical protein
LPLCKECLPIHQKEHISNKEIAMDGIINFEEARGQALGAFEERKAEIMAVAMSGCRFNVLSGTKLKPTAPR